MCVFIFVKIKSAFIIFVSVCSAISRRFSELYLGKLLYLSDI